MRKKLRSFVLREPVRTPVEISRSSTDDLRDEESDLSDLLKINYQTMTLLSVLRLEKLFINLRNNL